MTEPPAPLDDELLSAALGGEAAEEDAARIAADPVARARQDELRHAATLTGEPVPSLAADTVDDLVGRAVAAADAGDARDEDEGVLAPVRPLRHRSGPPPWSVAAAVLVLVAVGLGLVYRGKSADRHRQTSERAASSPASTTVAPAAAAADRASATPTTAAPQAKFADENGTAARPTAAGASAQSAIPRSLQVAPAGPVLDLGEFASTTALRAATRTGFPKALPLRHSVKVTLAEVVRCAGVIDNSPFPVRKRVTQAAATVAGTPVIVYRYDATPGAQGQARTLIVAVGPAACDPELVFFQA